MQNPWQSFLDGKERDKQYAQMLQSIKGWTVNWLEANAKKGDKGDKGEQGDRGLKGDRGEQGPKGEKGNRGNDGRDGLQGDQGIAGPAGKDGRDGKDGKDGKRGERGQRGEKGKDGASAYEVAKANGFTGNTQEWLESLKGKDGQAVSGGGGSIDRYRLIAGTTDPDETFGRRGEHYINHTSGEMFYLNNVGTWVSLGTIGGGSLGSITDAVAGQVPFGITGGALGQDSNLYWDNTNKRLGVGTASPTSKLHISGGDVRLDSTYKFLVPNGTYNVPQYSNDTYATGMAVTGNDEVHLVSNGKAVLAIKGAGTDYVKMISSAYLGWTNAFTNGSVDTAFSRGAANKIYVGNGSAGNYSGTLIAGNIGVNITSPTAKLHVVGSGSTSATNSLAVHNSTGSSNSLIIRDDNYVGFGRSTPYNANAGFEVSRTGSNAIFSFINPTGNSGSPFSLLIAVGDGSQVSTGSAIIKTPNNSITLAGNRTTFGVPTITTAQNAQTWKMFGGYGAGTLGDSMWLGANTGNAGNFTATSGTQNTLTLGYGLNSAYETWQPASGNATYNHFRILTSINTSGSYSGTVRSIYISPILTSLTGVSYRGIELDNSAGYSIYQSNSGGCNYFAGDVGIGVVTNNAAALLQVDSTTKGFLPPRMTTAQINAISSPPDGLVVYNTTLSALCFYDATGVAWRKVSHAVM